MLCILFEFLQRLNYKLLANICMQRLMPNDSPSAGPSILAIKVYFKNMTKNTSRRTKSTGEVSYIQVNVISVAAEAAALFSE